MHYLKGKKYQEIYKEEIEPLELKGIQDSEDLPFTNNIKTTANNAVKKIKFSISKPKPKNSKPRFSEKAKNELKQIWK